MAYYPFSPETGARYVLTSTDGVSAVFNDPSDPNYVGMLTEVTGLDSAEVRESADDLVEADGGQHGYFWLGRRPIVLTGRVFGHSSVAQRSARLDLGRRASFALRGDSTLSWKPSTRVENYVTNPRAQNDTVGWANGTVTGTATGGTLTRVTGIAPAVGTTGFQLATTGSGNANQGVAHSFTVQSGQTYAVSIAVKRLSGTGTYDVLVNGAASATVVTAASAGAFTVYTATFTASSSGTANLVVRSSNSNTAIASIQFSDVMVAPGTTTTYRDGDTAGWYWQGNQGNSASGDFIEMYTPVRRQQPWRESGAWNKDFQCALVSGFAPIFSTQQKSISAALAAGASVENRGSYAAYPVVNITGGGLANPTVTRTGGEVFRTTGLTVASGETLQVDFLNHTAVFTAGARNGQSGNRYIDFATTGWPSLPFGTSTLTLGGTGTGSMTVLWRDTWA